MPDSSPDKTDALSKPKVPGPGKHQRIFREIPPDEDEEQQLPPPSLDWMDHTLEWGVRVRPGKKGLTLGSLNVGIYGEIPDHWEDRTRMLRGSYPVTDMAPVAMITLRHKRELWADNAADLYEEAIQRRWVPATDIPWDTLEPLPDDVERAMCQLCTELCQHANVEYELIGGWLQQMSSGYHEVKVFVASEVFDAARHFDVFRKRALSNGGGLGLESRGEVDRVILQSNNDWSSASLFLHLLRGVFTLTLYRFGETYAHNPAEKAIFARCMQDKARHITYSLAHLRYAIAHQPSMVPAFQRVLDIAESQMVRDLKDPVLPEALAIIMGNGVEGVRTGMKRVGHLLGDFVRQYLRSAEWVGLPRDDKLAQGLAPYREL